MASHRVTNALNGVKRLTRSRARQISAARVPGSELVRIGGGDLLATPGIPELPTSQLDRDRGLCGETLALPAATVRLLPGVQICVGENLLRASDGSVVVSAPSSQTRRRPHRVASGGPQEARKGTYALHGSPGGSEFEALVSEIAPLVLLQHPSLRRVSPITVLHTGSKSMLEGFLLSAVPNQQVRLEQVPAGTVIEPDITAFPMPVTREGAGAVPRWFRRWVDQQAAAAPASGAARKLLVTHGPDDPLLRHEEVLSPAVSAGFTHVDTLTGHIEGDGTLDTAELVATLHGATDVIGGGDAALAATLLCRRTSVVQILTDSTVSPRVAQLAASKGLPHRLVQPSALQSVLDA